MPQPEPDLRHRVTVRRYLRHQTHDGGRSTFHLAGVGAGVLIGTVCGAHPTEPCDDDEHASALRLLLGHDEDATWCPACRRALAADLGDEPEPWHSFADEPAPRAERRLAELADRRLPDLAQLEISVRALEAENSSIIATLGSLVFADDRPHEEAALDDSASMMQLPTEAEAFDRDPEGRLS